jgi:hypothetical protein
MAAVVVAAATPGGPAAAATNSAENSLGLLMGANPVIVQYLGFRTASLGREYSFNVREAGEEREFTFNIANEAFTTRRATYQDAPGICAARLHAELAAFSNHPPATRFEITGTELDTYRESHKPPKPGRKAQEDF